MQKRLAAVTAPMCLIMSLLGGPAATAAPSVIRPARSDINCGTWHIGKSRNVAGDDALAGISADSEIDAWAVGSVTTDISRTLVEHFDGRAWSVVDSPNIGSVANVLTSVSAMAADDAWATGFYDDGAGFRTLIEHWDGTSWTVVPSPNPGTGENVLLSVAAVGPSDAWAVGYVEPTFGSVRRTLAERWDGTSWQVVSSPSLLNGDNYLFSVTARDPNDVWAVGAYSVPWFQTLAEHWDGTNWTVVPTPNFGNGDNVLYGTSVLPGGRAIGVGNWLAGAGTETLIEEWTGSRWVAVPAPSPEAYLNVLTSVAATGTHDIRAVGYGQPAIGADDQAEALHWDGTAWRAERPKSPGTHGTVLQGITRVPATGIFLAAGSFTDVAVRTLIEIRC